MQLVRRMARRAMVAAVVVAAGTALAGTGVAVADTVGAGVAPANIDAGAITLSRPAVDAAGQPAQVCGEGTMRIERSGSQRVEHADCSVTDVMGETIARNGAAASAPASAAPVFGERIVPSGAPASAAPAAVVSSERSLPLTGTRDAMPLVVGGLGALAMGGAAVVMARRRQSELLAAG